MSSTRDTSSLIAYLRALPKFLRMSLVIPVIVWVGVTLIALFASFATLRVPGQLDSVLLLAWAQLIGIILQLAVVLIAADFAFRQLHAAMLHSEQLRLSAEIRSTNTTIDVVLIGDSGLGEAPEIQLSVIVFHDNDAEPMLRSRPGISQIHLPRRISGVSEYILQIPRFRVAPRVELSLATVLGLPRLVAVTGSGLGVYVASAVWRS